MLCGCVSLLHAAIIVSFFLIDYMRPLPSQPSLVAPVPTGRGGSLAYFMISTLLLSRNSSMSDARKRSFLANL
jgi:hypothetical protein